MRKAREESRAGHLNGGRRTATRRAAAGAVLLFLALAPSLARADRDEEARKHFALGKERYSESRFEEAIVHFKAAAAIKPSPILDYNIGRCYDRLGQAQEAIEAYERYLSGKADAPNQAEVKARIETLRASIGAGASSHDETAPSAPPAKSPPAPPAPSSPRAAGEEGPVPEGAEKAGASGPTSDEARVGALATPSPPGPPSALAEEEPGTSRGPGPGGERVASREGMQHEAAAPYRRPPARQPRRDDGPIYKKWWFWVGLAGAAAIGGFIIGIAATSGSPKNSSTRSGSSALTAEPPLGPQLRF
jgi:hypothetical protein